MIKEGTYFIGWSWVMTELKLSGNEAIIYMIINGFSRKGRAWFTGSAGYLAEATNCSRATVLRILKKLTKQGFLKKRTVTRSGVTYCDYQSVVPADIQERYGYMEEEAEAAAKEETEAAAEYKESEAVGEALIIKAEEPESAAKTKETDWDSFLRMHGVAKPVPPCKRLTLVAQFEAFKQQLKAAAGMQSPPMALGSLVS